MTVCIVIVTGFYKGECYNKNSKPNYLNYYHLDNI